MTVKSNNRSSNIELLRIVMMLGVIFLHYQNSEIGGGSRFVDPGSVNAEVLMLFKSAAICAVDVFVLVTGFFSYKKERVGILKAIELLAQVVTFGLARYVLGCFLDSEKISAFGIIMSMLPRNWFILLYIALYLLTVYLNVVPEKLSKKQARAFLAVLIILFSVWPTLVDVLEAATSTSLQGMSTIGQQGSEFGYTIVTFVLMYYIGVYIGRYGVEYKTGRTVAAFGICFFIEYLWQHWNVQTATEYCNPVIICEAVAVFVLFSKLRFHSKAVNVIACASLTVYLTHTALLGHIGIEKFVNKSTAVLLTHVIISCCLIYMIGWIVWFVWDKITSPLWNSLNRIIKFRLSAETSEGEDRQHVS